MKKLSVILIAIAVVGTTACTKIDVAPCKSRTSNNEKENFKSYEINNPGDSLTQSYLTSNYQYGWATMSLIGQKIKTNDGPQLVYLVPIQASMSRAEIESYLNDRGLVFAGAGYFFSLIEKGVLSPNVTVVSLSVSELKMLPDDASTIYRKPVVSLVYFAGDQANGLLGAFMPLSVDLKDYIRQGTMLCVALKKKKL